MGFKPEVYVVVDELLTEVLRCQIDLDSQVRAIQDITVQMLDGFSWGKVDQGLCKEFCAAMVLPRSPSPIPAEILAKVAANGEPESKGVKGVQHKIVLAFATLIFSFIYPVDRAQAIGRAALHSGHRTENTDYRRVFKHLAQLLYEENGKVPAALIAAIGGRPKDIPEGAILHDELLDVEEKLNDLETETVIGGMPLQEAEPEPELEPDPPVQAKPTPKEEDELLDLYLPTFDDFKDVFKEGYPYLRVVNYEGKPHLGLGYVSGRRPRDGALIRRNCAVKYWDAYGEDTDEVHFKKIVSPFGVLESREGETRRFIKVLPLKTGMVIRSWSNLRNEPDMPGLNRYSVIDLDFTPKVFKDEEEMKQFRSVMRRECLRRGELKKPDGV